MKTKFFFLAALTSVALVSCTSDEYLGENPAPASSHETQGAIAFGSGANALTRATQNTGTVAQMLDGHFKIYGVKNTTGYTDVFQNYAVWNSTTKTTSNPDGADADADDTHAMNGWEYVGDGSAKGGLATQTIKYWDYSATDYHFVAGSPASSFTFNLTSGDVTSATVTGLAGHITANAGASGTTVYNPVYIADPVKVLPAAYQQEVTFSFKRQQTFVRVGVFETVPGYSISEIHFYEQAASDWKATAETSQNIILASKTANYFSGATNGTATVTYNWTTPTSTFEYTTATLTQAKNWYGGALVGVPATSSTGAVADLYGTDKDMATTGYFTVIPSASALEAQPILIKCDYVLTAEDGKGETITVTGATAAIPAAFCKWNPNTSYTYLFKISDNTNGSTGDPDSDPEGLFPITFDAMVEATTDAVDGIITSVTTPSITTYQEGSVSSTGVQYKYNSSDPKPIYFTAQNDETGALLTLTTGAAAVSHVQVYKLAAAATEADLQLTAPVTTVTTTAVGSATTVGSWSIPAGAAYFTPTSTGYYAIQYQTATSPAAYTYKVVKVE